MQDQVSILCREASVPIVCYSCTEGMSLLALR